MNFERWGNVFALLGAGAQMIPLGDTSEALQRLVARLDRTRSLPAGSGRYGGWTPSAPDRTAGSCTVTCIVRGEYRGRP
jgi:hypothetical protein